jgi:hypothetical protein
MRRREFIAGLGGAAAWPVVVRARQAAVPVISIVSSWKHGETSGDLQPVFPRIE